MSFNATLPQSDKARSLFQSLRAKSRGDPASLPASTRGSQAPGQGGIEVEDDFVEVQRKRRRAEEATREEVQRKKVRLEEVLGESQEVEGRTDRLGLKAPSSQAEDPESSRAAFARGGEMPPPPVPDKNKNKRKAVDTEESDTNFLRAPVKRKKKGEAEDPLDVDFNNLRIAKNVAFSATTPEIPVVDGVIPRIIPQYVAVKRRERPAQPSNHPENGPNFKKFHSNKVRPPCGSPLRQQSLTQEHPLCVHRIPTRSARLALGRLSRLGETTRATSNLEAVSRDSSSRHFIRQPSLTSSASPSYRTRWQQTGASGRRHEAIRPRSVCCFATRLLQQDSIWSPLADAVILNRRWQCNSDTTKATHHRGRLGRRAAGCQYQQDVDAEEGRRTSRFGWGRRRREGYTSDS